MLRIALLLLLLTGPIACAPTQGGGVHRSAQTGIDGAYSAQRVISDHRHYVLLGRVMVLRQDDRVVFSADIGQRRISGHPRLRLRRAWRDGVALPFRGTWAREPYCIGQTRCDAYSTGVLTFTADAFRAAMQYGVRAHLTGPDGTIDVVIPAEMFIEAAARASASGLLD